MFPSEADVTKEILTIFSEIAARCAITPIEVPANRATFPALQLPGSAVAPPTPSWIFSRDISEHRSVVVWYWTRSCSRELLAALRGCGHPEYDGAVTVRLGPIKEVIQIWTPGRRPKARDRVFDHLLDL